jgi:hypothetical protein
MARGLSLGLTAAILFLVLPWAANARAQSADASDAISAPTARELLRMTRSAAVIFVGQVVAVRRPSEEDAASHGIVTVEFRVDEAVRGCAQGSIYTLREWAGLWYADDDRYRVGQRLLLFLHRPNTSGLSSPVQGAAGVVPLRGGGAAPGPYDAAKASSDWLADLRWVQAQAVRTDEPKPAGGDPRLPSNDAALVPISGAGRTTPWIAMPPETERTTQPLSQVLRLCRGWMEPVRVER